MEVGAAALLLHRVRDLVRDELSSGARLGIVLPAGEMDVASRGVGTGADGRGRFAGSFAGVNSYVSQIGGERRAEALLQLGRQRVSRRALGRGDGGVGVGTCPRGRFALRQRLLLLVAAEVGLAVG
jgi:hypothetical protein